MKYSMNCPMCQAPMMTEAADDVQAMPMMKETAKQHMITIHPEAPVKADMEMEEMIKGGWTKSE